MLVVDDYLKDIDTTSSEFLLSSQVLQLEKYLADYKYHSMGIPPYLENQVYLRLAQILSLGYPRALLTNLVTESGYETPFEFKDNLPPFTWESLDLFCGVESSDFQDFITQEENGIYTYFTFFQVEGLPVRLLYRSGELVCAATPACGVLPSWDVIDCMREVVGGECLALSEYEWVEVYGRITISVDNFKNLQEIYPQVISPRLAIPFLLASEKKEEWEMLDFLAAYVNNKDLIFSSRSNEFLFLSEECKFLVPETHLATDIEGFSSYDMQEIIEFFQDISSTYLYPCQGLVFSLDEYKDSQERNFLGDLVFFIPEWNTYPCSYTGIIQDIKWVKGKEKLSPVAVLGDNILGVSEVPLFDVRNILLLEAYPGREINFQYGKKVGPLPCFPSGEVLFDDFVLRLLAGEQELLPGDKTSIDTQEQDVTPIKELVSGDNEDLEEQDIKDFEIEVFTTSCIESEDM